MFQIDPPQEGLFFNVSRIQIVYFVINTYTIIKILLKIVKLVSFLLIFELVYFGIM